MVKRLVALFGVTVILLIAVTSASAVIDGTPDGNGHPYVGLIVFDVNGSPSHRCTGTLLTSRVVLTAGHCTEGTSAARVWFDADVSQNPEYPFSGATSYDGVPYTYPGYTFILPNTGDVGVVVLTEPAAGLGTAVLAPVGYLNDFETKRGQKDVDFEIVGYGRQGVKPDLIAERVRYRGTVKLNNLRNALTDGYNIQVSGDNGKGNDRSALCFGDSGGAIFHPVGSNQIVAVNSFVLNSQCAGNGFAYRTDTADVWNWVMGFVVANP